MKHCEICTKNECLIFANTQNHVHEEINKYKRCVEFKKGQQVLKEGLESKEMFFVQHGVVKIHKKGWGQREQTLRLAGPNKIFGYREISHTAKSNFSATIMRDSLICTLPSEIFESLLARSPQLGLHALTVFAEELNRTENKLNNMAQMTVREKIIDSIIMLYETFGLSEDLSLAGEISRTDIAEIAGINPDQVSRGLQELVGEGLLELRTRKIIIPKPELLQARLNNYYP